MKRLTGILTAALLLAALGVGAQDAPKRERASGRSLAMFGLPPQLGDKLKLTDDQKQKAAEVAKKHRPQLEEIRKQMMEEFRGVLTDEQRKILDDAIEQMRKRFQQGRGENKRPPGDDGEHKPESGAKP